MTNRERFLAVLNGRLPDDRLPMIEWATWWNLTLDRWHGEGLDPEAKGDALFRAQGLDVNRQYWLRAWTPDLPQPAYHGAPIMEEGEEGYEKLKKYLYPDDANEWAWKGLREGEADHQAGDVMVWGSLEGGFWFPRRLMGIEDHLYSFYDYPELYHRILDDLAEFNLRELEKMFAICTPEFITIAEDMSYNNGPMLSEELFDEFVAPYYRKIIPFIHAHGSKVLVDTDGDVTMLIPWLRREGVDGILPLERQAGVDVVKIRETYPDLLMLGGYDKMVMKHGEEAMRAEFERLLPAMKAGRYIPSVDHQTPPDVSLENYRIYVKLLREYTEKAVRG